VFNAWKCWRRFPFGGDVSPEIVFGETRKEPLINMRLLRNISREYVKMIIRSGRWEELKNEKTGQK
jgi:hypothetical protein